VRRRCLTISLFEDLPASDRRAPGVSGLSSRRSCNPTTGYGVVLIVSEKRAIFSDKKQDMNPCKVLIHK
jgi:hypothetical protein